MKISPILNPRIYQIQNKNNTSQNRYLTNTSLTRDTVSFSGKEDFLNLPNDEIFQRIDSALKDPKNKLGEGGEAYVYKIPNTEFCVRIGKDDENDFEKNFTLKISEKDKVNHVVAKLGNNSSIMRIIKGETLWQPEKTPLEIAKTIQAVEEIPVEGFKKLLIQVCEANKHDMIFDSVGTNIIVDKNAKTLTAIDFFQSEFSEPFTPLKSIYASLTHFDCPISYKTNCAQKLILAACEDLREGANSIVPIGGYDFHKFIQKLEKDEIIKNKNFTNALSKVLDNISDLQIKKYLGNECNATFEGQMKILKVLLKQIF